MKTKEKWVKSLGLLPHPEGGYYKETYRSQQNFDINLMDEKLEGKRSLSTGIYFLLEIDNFSAFHRIKSDEMWHFYDGDPLIVHMINELGQYSSQIIGRDVEKGEKLQFVVPANVWFASEVVEGGEYSLVGCTVSFGFDFQDFELADKDFKNRFIEHKEITDRLVR